MESKYQLIYRILFLSSNFILIFTQGIHENPPPFPFGLNQNDQYSQFIRGLGGGQDPHLLSNYYTSHQSWQPINQWGFSDPAAVRRLLQLTQTTTPLIPTERPFLPDHRAIPANDFNQGLLKDVGPINVGFGIAVPAVKDNDPVSVGTRVGVGLGFSGLAGRIPVFFTTQGEAYSRNDYDGDKRNIVPDKALKYYLAVKEAQERERQELLRELVAKARPQPIPSNDSIPKNPFDDELVVW